MSTFLLVAALNMFVDSGVCCVSHSDEFLCYQMSEQTCELVGGRWSPSGNDCETFVCTAFGACCMPDLSAFSSSAAECNSKSPHRIVYSTPEASTWRRKAATGGARQKETRLTKKLV